MANRHTPSVISLVTLALWATLSQCANVGFQGMEDTCILSFMVPRDKMKSSCELDSKVNRRINAMEMKVNIYQQQVADLHDQMEKQRLTSMEKLDTLDRQVKESTVNSDMSFLIERRLALLEKEFEQLYDDLAKVKARPVPSGATTANSGAFNALDNNPVTLPNLVRSMVQSEVNAMMVNFTRQLEGYVQEQILLYNRVFNMLPKPDEVRNGRTFSTDKISLPDSSSSSKKKDSDEDQSDSRLKKNIDEEFDKMTASLNDEISKQVGDLVKSITSPLPDNSVGGDTLDSTDSKDDLNITSLLNETLTLSMENATNSLELDLGDEANDSYSGDKSDKTLAGQQDNYTNLNQEIPVSSRMSHGGDEGKDVDLSDKLGVKGEGEVTESSQDRWKENMVRDEQSHRDVIEEIMRTEITSMLYSPLAKVMSLIKEQATTFEEKLANQKEKAQEATTNLRSQIQILDQHMLSTADKVDSLTKGFQDMREVLETVHTLETVVSEIQKNMTNSLLHGALSPLELDEQMKKVKKLERLIGVYQHSLDHYRNETKLEYREIREQIDLETKGLKRFSKDVENDVTNQINSALGKLNSTYLDKFREIADQIRIHEDNAMLMQIDINNIDRKVSGKSSRSDKEIDELREDIRQASNKHRDIRKRFEAIEREQITLSEHINSTVKDIFDLKTEVKLSILDEWLPLNFAFDTSRTKCFGDQYVKRSPFKEPRLVGVVLCNATRYKIFLSNSLHSTFLNIGDMSGLGEDHCEFVGAKEGDGDKITLNFEKPPFGVVEGYSRNLWGEKPQLDRLNAIKLSPWWYECGVSIP